MSVATLRPAACPAGIEPRRWRGAIRARIQTQLAKVEALIAALGAMEGGADLEDDGDLEPSIGGNSPWGQEVDLELDESDREPDCEGGPAWAETTDQTVLLAPWCERELH